MNVVQTKKIDHLINKVPQVTLLFWLIKMMSTTVGETAADLLQFKLHWGIYNTTLFMGVLLVIAMIFQLRSRVYRPVIYWTAVVFVSIFGTLATDILTDKLDISLVISSSVFSMMLLGVFAFWYSSQNTLSIQHIDTPARERFYWAAILITFALGTAVGDLVSEDMNVGYINTALIFGGMIAAAAIAHYKFNASPVTTFWIAYIFTRPLGASCGDLLAKSAKHGGFGFGVVNTSIVFFGVIIVCIAYLEWQDRRLFKTS